MAFLARRIIRFLIGLTLLKSLPPLKILPPKQASHSSVCCDFMAQHNREFDWCIQFAELFALEAVGIQLQNRFLSQKPASKEFTNYLFTTLRVTFTCL
jgi:hypothetical protein